MRLGRPGRPQAGPISAGPQRCLLLSGADPKLLNLDWNIAVMPPAEYEMMFAEVQRAYTLAGEPAAVVTKIHDGPHKVNNEAAFQWLNKQFNSASQP